MESPVDRLIRSSAAPSVPIVHLFGAPFVTVGARHLEVPEGSKRLLAFVAIHRGPVDRRQTAGTLWPSGTDQRAAGNLRSALWRLKAIGVPLLRSDRRHLALLPDVVVDLHVVNEWLTRLMSGAAGADDLGVIPWSDAEIDLLPGWYDDWALLERERVAQRTLHGLELQSRRLIETGRYAEAVEAAIVAVCADPLRESAQQALIEACLAEGNVAEAHRRLQLYRERLRSELNAEPSQRLAAILSADVLGSAAS